MADTYIRNHTEQGDICISEDVLTSIVMAAVNDVDGVAGYSNAIGADISEFLGLGKNIGARGVKIIEDEGRVIVDVVLTVRYGYGITDVAKKVQTAVSESLESMTGLKIVTNVHVSGISFEKTDIKG